MTRQELEEDNADIHPSLNVISIGIDSESKMIAIPGTNYRMGQTQVTQRLYKKVMKKNPSWFQPNNTKLNNDQQNKLGRNTINNPVEGVSWYDAVYFCNKLSMMEELSPAYSVDGEVKPNYWGYTPHKGEFIMSEVKCDFDANGYRLPTNDEWEKAANGGIIFTYSTFSYFYTYSGSENLNIVGWNKYNSNNVTHPVAQKMANGYGLYDMSGNVREWVWETHPVNSSLRCNRGGGFESKAEDCEVSYQSGDYAIIRYYDLGFRLLRSLD